VNVAISYLFFVNIIQKYGLLVLIEK